MGRFANLRAGLKGDPLTSRLKGIEAVRDATGPAKFVQEEVGKNEKDMYDEPGIVDEIIQCLRDKGPCRAPVKTFC